MRRTQQHRRKMAAEKEDTTIDDRDAAMEGKDKATDDKERVTKDKATERRHCNRRGRKQEKRTVRKVKQKKR